MRRTAPLEAKKKEPRARSRSEPGDGRSGGCDSALLEKRIVDAVCEHQADEGVIHAADAALIRSPFTLRRIGERRRGADDQRPRDCTDPSKHPVHVTPSSKW